MMERQLDDTYQPIHCGFHDELLAWATLAREVNIVYRNGQGSETEVQGVIVDVFTRDRAEFLRLHSGTEIRLDRLVEVADA